MAAFRRCSFAELARLNMTDRGGHQDPTSRVQARPMQVIPDPSLPLLKVLAPISAKDLQVASSGLLCCNPCIKYGWPFLSLTVPSYSVSRDEYQASGRRPEVG
jgi:hypothetical protein